LPRIARVCMAALSMRSWLLGTRSSPKNSPLVRGLNSEAASVGLRAPGMFIAWLKRDLRLARAAPQGARSHAHHQTLAVLSWLRPVNSEASVAALASVPLWHLGPARPLLGGSFRLFGSTSVASLVCPIAVRRRYGKVGNPACAHAYEHAIQRASARQPVPRSFGIPGDRARVCPKVQAA
jgi:hypothetical protein